jgi:general stress protein YciG
MAKAKTPGKRKRGFAAMSPEKQREIASRGGKRSHECGKGHEFTSNSARLAGRLGGMASNGGRGSEFVVEDKRCDEMNAADERCVLDKEHEGRHKNLRGEEW